MKTYREKIVEVQAVQWCGQNSGEVHELCGHTKGDCNSWILPYGEGLMIRSIDGNVIVPKNSYIVRSNKGTKQYYLYIYSESEFKDKYESPISRWINVKDRFPEKNDFVIAYAPVGGRDQPHKFTKECCYHGDGYFKYSNYYMQGATHWMPLPKYEEVD